MKGGGGCASPSLIQPHLTGSAAKVSSRRLGGFGLVLAAHKGTTAY